MDYRSTCDDISINAEDEAIARESFMPALGRRLSGEQLEARLDRLRRRWSANATETTGNVFVWKGRRCANKKQTNGPKLRQ